MKYRIVALTVRKKRRRPTRPLAARKKQYAISILSPEIYGGSYREFRERIDTDTLFSLGELPSPPKESSFLRLKRRLNLVLKNIYWEIKDTSVWAFSAIITLLKRRLNAPAHPVFFAGVACSAISVAAVSALTVVATLFFPYLAPYDTLTVPDLSGVSIAEVERVYGNKLTLLIAYEYSDEYPAGAVISQIPAAGVTRKLYGRDTPPELSLKISSGRHFYTVEKLIGENERNALLTLRNAAIPVKVIYKHSNNVPQGVVISTSPAEGQRVFDGETITLTVSLGKEILTASVPNLYGLTEAQAHSVLEQKGLRVGKITYKNSDATAGTVIVQGHAPYSSVPLDTSVDLTVSLGSLSPQRLVPDLYGLTVLEATESLAAVGLVIGGIFTVDSPARQGTVIIQGIAAGTPITPSITSVDVYISS